MFIRNTLRILSYSFHPLIHFFKRIITIRFEFAYRTMIGVD
jgi:hypothetical protein